MQQQQQALYQQQLASNQVLSFQTPGLAPNRHRRVQSTVPSGAATGFAASQSLGQYGLGLDGQPQGVPRGHGRRHSVNVVNKGTAPPVGAVGYGYSQDGFDDGFAPPSSFGGHSRQASRADSSWRISMLSSRSRLYS